MAIFKITKQQINHKDNIKSISSRKSALDPQKSQYLFNQLHCTCLAVIHKIKWLVGGLIKLLLGGHESDQRGHSRSEMSCRPIKASC